MTEEEKIKLSHGYMTEYGELFYRNRFKLDGEGKIINIIHYPMEDIPQKLLDLLMKRMTQYKTKNLEFSTANLGKAWAIAIVNYRDSFDHKIGSKIVKGRLEKALGLNDKIKYHGTPNFICYTE